MTKTQNKPETENKKGCGKHFTKRDLLLKRDKYTGEKMYSENRKAICGEVKLGNAFIDYCDNCKLEMGIKEELKKRLGIEK